jgi:glycosyltransferase involved in cell wall biosynthesis
MSQTPVCSIIIRAYNEAEHIGKLLMGIQAQTVKDVQIILVDSGSSDDTVAIARQYPVEVVNIRPEDFSFGRSLNTGFEHAKGEFVVMASAHVYPVYPDWLEQMLAPFKDEKVALTYGKQRGAEKTQFSEHQIFHHWYPDNSTSRQTTPFCNNANSAVRRSLWQQHPYDETLPGLEDLAWGKWAQEKGYAIAYCAEAEIIHVHNESLNGIYNRYRREGMAFKQIYPHETFTRRDMWRLFFQNTFADYREAARQGRLGKDFWNITRFRWYQFSGTYQGYKQSGPLTWRLKQAFYYPHQVFAPSTGKNDRSVAPIQYGKMSHEKDKKELNSGGQA